MGRGYRTLAAPADPMHIGTIEADAVAPQEGLL